MKCTISSFCRPTVSGKQRSPRNLWKSLVVLLLSKAKEEHMPMPRQGKIPCFSEHLGRSKRIRHRYDQYMHMSTTTVNAQIPIMSAEQLFAVLSSLCGI
mmetsp:Transcript_6966/g.13647  ORF Transcript_6966/g.13647 Transcript_6966/m.13647 type:complete len:99 (+) Transcript_6966:818-1114(+)